MKYPIFSYRDKLNGYGAIVTHIDCPNMIRDFAYDINNTPKLRYNHSDYELWQVGTFDSESGFIESMTPKLVQTGNNVYVEEEK